MNNYFFAEILVIFEIGAYKNLDKKKILDCVNSILRD